MRNFMRKSSTWGWVLVIWTNILANCRGRDSKWLSLNFSSSSSWSWSNSSPRMPTSHSSQTMQVLRFSLFFVYWSYIILKDYFLILLIAVLQKLFPEFFKMLDIAQKSDEQNLESFFLPVEVKENLEVILSYNEAGRSPVKLFELEVSTSEVILLVHRLSLT